MKLDPFIVLCLITDVYAAIFSAVCGPIDVMVLRGEHGIYKEQK
jgi:hypothetical protein